MAEFCIALYRMSCNKENKCPEMILAVGAQNVVQVPLWVPSSKKPLVKNLFKICIGVFIWLKPWEKLTAQLSV